MKKKPIGIFGILLIVLIFSLPISAFAKEPVEGVQVNRYLGNINDGATWPEEYEAEVFRFLSLVNPDWNDEQKIMFLHDYLVTRSDYDFEGLKNNELLEGQYGVLLGRGGICSAYSEIFMELATRMGLKVKTVHSQMMNHEWNLIQIDGEWYFLDTTWDDGSYETEMSHFKMFCDHEFLLKSQSVFRHGATDWYSLDENDVRENAYNVYNNDSNKTYDNACWNDSLSPVVIWDDGFLVLKQNGQIYKCDSKGGNEVLITTVSTPTRYGTMVAVEGFVFVCNADTIYQLNTVSGGLTKIYSLSQTEKDNYGAIYGIEPEGTRLRYDMGTAPGKGYFKSSGYLNLETVVGAEVKGTSINQNAVTFYEAGTSYALKLTDCNGNTVSADSWKSSDPEVATVNANGLVTAVGFGKTYITATKNGKNYRCMVAFDTEWQNEYIYGVWEGTYQLSGYLYLDQHIESGMKENMVIPAFAYVGGDRYTTCIRSAVFTGSINGRMRTGTEFFPNNDIIQSVVLENGTCIEENAYGKFKSCSKLKSFDFGGADLSYCYNLDGFFINCSSLEFVNLQGCRIDNSDGVLNFLKYPRNIKRILTPSFIRDGLSIPLSVKLRVKNADGSLGSEEITDLSNAPLNAELLPPDDTSWQADYEYHISAVSGRSGNYLCLDKYIGTKEDVYIPAKAIVEGKEYPVCIRGAETNGDKFSTASLFRASQTTLKSFAAEEGVIVDTYYSWYLFMGNTALTDVDFEGVDLSQTKYLYGPFWNCTALENISFKGCSFGSLTTVPNFFDNCRNIKKIIVPDVIADGISITLPITMYELNEDGTTKDTGYTKLEDAPRGCTLVSEKNVPVNPDDPVNPDEPDDPVVHVHQLIYTEGKEATCMEAGNSGYWYCDECNKYFSDDNAEYEIAKDSWILPALGHAYKEVEGSAAEATCVTSGKNADKKCSRCEDFITGSTIPAKGHTEEEIQAVEVSCTEKGFTAGKKCSECGEILEAPEEIPAPGHQWDEGVVTKEPTEEETGERLFTCGRCGITHTTEIPKLDHVHDLTHVEATEPSCTEAGNSEYWHCEGCGGYFSDEEAVNEIVEDSWIIASPGHDYMEEEGTATEPSCTENGKNADKKCTRCDDVIEGSVIPAKGHTEEEIPASAPTCTEKGTTAGKKCSECGEITEAPEDIPATGHKWDEGVITKEPTTSEEGIKTFTCENCGDSYTENISKLKSGWEKEDGKWYYYDANGNKSAGWQKINSVWYYFNQEGAMQTGWLKDGSSWYYLASSGAMQTGWIKDNNKWYYMSSGGAMQTGWVKVNNNWYYLNSAMQTGWVQLKGTWYFLKPNGIMAENEWYDGYWLSKGGAWTYKAKGSWKKNSKGWWFGDTSGWYAKSTTIKINDKNYTFKKDGYLK